MNSHTYATIYDLIGDGEPGRWYREAIITMPDAFLVAQARVEQTWHAERKPYYTVYPLAAESLRKITLDVPCSAISLPISALSIRFGAGREPWCDGRKLHALLAGQLTVRDNERGLGVWIDFGERKDMLGVEQYPIYSYVSLSLAGMGSVEDSLRDLDYVEQDSQESAAIAEALRYVVAVALLAHDPEIIEPDVLAKDRDKWGETHDPAIAERAVRRGKRGWLVGAHMESMPHYRRPHFALRWTGEGRRIPRIAAVKGSIVHRTKLGEVPQGHQDDEK